MDWNGLNHGNESPEHAFEAFCSHIFERWCRQTYSSQLLHIYSLDGSGGDGGVEAFAELHSGAVIGLQAKWFRERLNASRGTQIRASLSQAVSRHPKLAKYIVVVPHDLSDAKKPKEKSERDRWEELTTWAGQHYPSVSVEYWGDTAVEGQLIANEDLSAFWFPRSTIKLANFSDLVARVCEVWFSERYLPDLHCVGHIDLAVSRHLHLAPIRTGLLQRLRQPHDAVRSGIREVHRLSRLPDFGPNQLSRLTIIAKALTELEALAGYAEQMRKAWSTGSLKPMLPTPPRDWNIDATGELCSLLADLDKKSVTHAPSHQCLKVLKGVLVEVDALATLCVEFAEMQQPLAVIGRPGIGKTHSLVACAQRHAEHGMPVLLIPARSEDPQKRWASILCEAMDLSGWSAAEALAAIEAATHVADSRFRGKFMDGDQPVALGPSRALIVIDGLEESPHASQWQHRLAELASMVKEQGRIVIVCATRDETARVCLGTPQHRWHVEHVYASSSLNLGELFRKYCRHYGIDVGALTWLGWALRNALGIRLFCELNKNSTMRAGHVVATTIPQLLREKITRLEEELRVHATLGWPPAEQVLPRVLRAIAAHFVGGDVPLRHDGAVDLMRAAHGDITFMTRGRADHILVGCRTHGILDSWRVPADDPLCADEWVYRLAFNVITDYVLADEIAKRMLSSKPHERKEFFPPVLLGRPSTSAMVVAMLAQQDVHVVLEGIWDDHFAPEQLGQWQLRAVADLPAPKALMFHDWIKIAFVRSMTSCRRVLAELVVPSARIPGSPYGSGFVDQVLREYSAAARDVFWSGPDYLPDNHGAPWEGRASWPLSGIHLTADDKHDGLPLLLAWSCTSLVKARRREARAALSAWGGANPIEMAALIRRITTANDGQMIEDVFIAAAGAAMKSRDREGLLALAMSCDAMLFSPNAEAATHNAITRNAARVIVERAAVLDCEVPADLLSRARPPYRLRDDIPLRAQERPTLRWLPQWTQARS